MEVAPLCALICSEHCDQKAILEEIAVSDLQTTATDPAAVPEQATAGLTPDQHQKAMQAFHTCRLFRQTVELSR